MTFFSATQFLKLADATKDFIKPCVMDVKIGKQTWEPGASATKQQNEEVSNLCPQLFYTYENEKALRFCLSSRKSF